MSTETLPLFSGDATAVEPFDTISAAARAKLGKGPEWRWSDSRVVGDAYLVKGGVPHRTRAGRMKWDRRTLDEVILTRADFDAARATYERDTGRCAKCSGTGEWSYGWTKDTGRLVKPCPRCNATGKAPTTEAP